MRVHTSLIVFNISVRHKAVVLRAAAKQKQRIIGFAYEYTYQDSKYIVKTMNTKHEWCHTIVWLSSLSS